MTDDKLQIDCIICSKCKIIPEEFLSMDCDHHICLKCASLELRDSGKDQTQKITKINDIALKCNLCSGLTPLQESTITYLKNYNFKNEKQYIKKITEADLKAEEDQTQNSEKQIEEANEVNEADCGVTSGVIAEKDEKSSQVKLEIPKTEVSYQNDVKKSERQSTNSSGHAKKKEPSLKNVVRKDAKDIKDTVSRRSSKTGSQAGGSSKNAPNRPQKWEKNLRGSGGARGNFFTGTHVYSNLVYNSNEKEANVARSQTYSQTSTDKKFKKSQTLKKTSNGPSESLKKTTNFQQKATTKTTNRLAGNIEKAISNTGTSVANGKGGSNYNIGSGSSYKNADMNYASSSRSDRRVVSNEAIGLSANKSGTKSKPKIKNNGGTSNEKEMSKSTSPIQKSPEINPFARLKTSETRSPVNRSFGRQITEDNYPSGDNNRLGHSDFYTSKDTKQVRDSKSLSKSNLNDKQRQLLDSIRQNNEIDFDLGSSSKKEDQPTFTSPHLTRSEVQPGYQPRGEERVFEKNDQYDLLNNLDERLGICDKLLSHELLVENQLRQNFVMVGNIMKRSFTNFINYLKLKEKETLKILDNSYHANLKEFQDSSKNCKMFTGRFKFIAENIRELIKFQSEDEKQYFINHKLSFIQKEVPFSNKKFLYNK